MIIFFLMYIPRYRCLKSINKHPQSSQIRKLYYFQAKMKIYHEYKLLLRIQVFMNIRNQLIENLIYLFHR